MEVAVREHLLMKDPDSYRDGISKLAPRCHKTHQVCLRIVSKNSYTRHAVVLLINK